MAMIRTILWVLLLLMLAVFMTANWVPVTVTVWPGQVMDTKLPLLLLISFLIGLLPVWIAYRTTKWSLRRRLDHSERQLAQARDQHAAATAAAAGPSEMEAGPLTADAGAERGA